MERESGETSKSRAQTKIEFLSSGDSVDLFIVQSYSLLSGSDDMAASTGQDANRAKESGHHRVTNALSVLLNLALLTSSERFPCKAAFLISAPMCSPSRSQSVHMKRAEQ